MRLKNLLGYPQEEAANQMGVSQPTFHRLINAAHQKITDAIINGKALRIDGGNVTICGETPAHATEKTLGRIFFPWPYVPVSGTTTRRRYSHEDSHNEHRRNA